MASDEKWHSFEEELAALRVRIGELEEELEDAKDEMVTAERLEKAKGDLLWKFITFGLALAGIAIAIVALAT